MAVGPRSLQPDYERQPLRIFTWKEKGWSDEAHQMLGELIGRTDHFLPFAPLPTGVTMADEAFEVL